ncbi:hypothetical protein DI53_1587 [Sphingobacterium deserti]|uniref:Uncharacterized protein n=1 Tax=Sphingobacterium deserti TaxID=1229276 RepID=A0A0B8T4E9_9SPHI|nr:hypothetical protein DI53_1587 [Sphingobacterium deserti]
MELSKKYNNCRSDTSAAKSPYYIETLANSYNRKISYKPF